MVVQEAWHERLGTGTDFLEMLPMDLRRLGTGEVNFKYRYNGFNGYEVRLGTGSVF